MNLLIGLTFLRKNVKMKLSITDLMHGLRFCAEMNRNTLFS